MPNVKTKNKRNYKNLTKFVLKEKKKPIPKKIVKQSKIHNYKQISKIVLQDKNDLDEVDHRFSMDDRLYPGLDVNRYTHMYKHMQATPSVTNKHKTSIYDSVEIYKHQPTTPSVTNKHKTSIYDKKLQKQKRDTARKFVKELREKQKKEIDFLKKKKREEVREIVRKLREKQKKELSKVSFNL